MQSPKPSFFILPFLLLSLFQAPALEAKKAYVVYMGSHSHGPELTEAHLDHVKNSHHEFLGSFLGSHEEARDALYYSYQRHINGFAAVMDHKTAAKIAKHPKVVSVFPDRAKKLHTTRSWDFMMLGNNGMAYHGSLWRRARFGEDIIIANLDTGVWPESESFSDKGMGPVPARWKGGCEKDPDAGVACNRKLIGARYFSKGYETYYGDQNLTMPARDIEGHGSHTLSTAGGNFVRGVSVFGLGNGTASGGSPKARVASYKVCWPPVLWGGSCFDSDILAAFDVAIHDGVDVLSLSLGGEAMDYFEDGLAIGAFHAVKHGITVVCSAGNSGPSPATVSNVAPWILTVGASTLDRVFDASVTLKNGQRFKGTTLSEALPDHKYYPLMSGADARTENATAEQALLCQADTLDPKKVKGKILACLRGDNGRVDKGIQALKAGAVGMILCNDEASSDELIADPHVLPTSHIVYKDGVQVFKYINSTKNPVASLAPPETQLRAKPAPVMAAFSSQGPNTVTAELLKPDITAPGVNIIAAFTGATSPAEDEFDKRRVPYLTMTGTSMSCPHVSGVVGLLRRLYPNWSSAAIRSAIMTTASTRDNAAEAMLNATYQKATPFSYGAGHIQPNKAMNPGLVYDLTMNDYLDFLCASGYNTTALQIFNDVPYKCHKGSRVLDLNYPSITVPELYESVTIRRRVKNVGAPRSVYVARVQCPAGVTVSVQPKILNFLRRGEEKCFTVTVTPKLGAAATKGGVGEREPYRFGALTWTDGKHSVRSPIVVGKCSCSSS